jgi:hypothetical protein
MEAYGSQLIGKSEVFGRSTSKKSDNAPDELLL